MSDGRLEGVAPTVPDVFSDEAVRVARLVAELTPEQQGECLDALEVMGLIAPGEGGDGPDEAEAEFVATCRSGAVKALELCDCMEHLGEKPTVRFPAAGEVCRDCEAAVFVICAVDRNPRDIPRAAELAQEHGFDPGELGFDDEIPF